jgi:hypothetical protein
MIPIMINGPVPARGGRVGGWVVSCSSQTDEAVREMERVAEGCCDSECRPLLGERCLGM